MPRRSKKKFIDKKSAVTFHLVHRSQRDPLAANDEAPQRVLLPVGSNSVEYDNVEETDKQREDRISSQKTYGIEFDDDYDYMQHLRDPNEHTTVLIPVNSNKPNTVNITGMGGNCIEIPAIALASKEEEDIGMLHRAIPPVGPQVDWDPDIVAAMDEDFDFENPENVLEDDFFSFAMAGGNDDSNSEHSGENHDLTDDTSTCADAPNNAFFDQFMEEETRSRFTRDSMSSSALPRPGLLSLLDERFEKFIETYDDEDIDDLPQYSRHGGLSTNSEETLRLILGIKKDQSDEVVKTVKPSVCVQERIIQKSSNTDSCDSHSDANDDDDDDVEEEEGEEEEEEEMVYVAVKPKIKWDCESILSTYSKTRNRPTMIEDEPNKPIKLSKRTGIPLNTLTTSGLTAKKLRTLDLQNAEQSERIRTTSEASRPTVTTGCINVRKKEESKEEKKARKQMVKETNRERRVEKKATKVAFKQERNRQNKELMNLHHNLNGIKIS